MSSDQGSRSISRRGFLSSLGGLGTALTGVAAPAAAATSSADALRATPPSPPIVGGDPRTWSPTGFALGSENFLKKDWEALEGRRVGLVTNQTGVLSDGDTLLSMLLRNPKIKVRALYSPEHGLHGNHTAGSHVGSSHDEATGLPVYSLYGKTKKPTKEMLADIDILLFDIQDVGARTYTYISTLAMVMQGAGEHGKSVWVLDRPNPIGGSIVEGPVLEPAFESFIGLYPMPMRHGMTIGEVGNFYHQSCGIKCDYYVVRMSEYTRAMYWPETHLKWTPTSPNIPHFRTAMVYLTTGPIGGANIVNGVGSTKPFEIAVQPGLDGTALADTLNQRGLPGVKFTPLLYVPDHGYWSGQQLNGVTINVTHYTRYLAVHTALEIMAAIHRIAPGHLKFDEVGFDRDWGTATVREWISAGMSPGEMQQRWQARLDVFMRQRQAALLYTINVNRAI